MNLQESQMSEKAKKQKGTISEEDVSTILQRYTATTVLTLLQEVAQIEDARIDWIALVKRTTTGITNPREYQMLWRHIAYRETLLEKVEDEVKPLDDDSDLDYELEAFPAVSNEASMEAAACVKVNKILTGIKIDRNGNRNRKSVLIASGSTCDSGLEKGLTIEAPLTINIPNAKSARNLSENPQHASNMGGTNITIPVSVQKQPLPTVASTEGLDTIGSGSGSLPPRRKRKPWTTAEDLELFAAVQKCGEGNWANILKGDFKGDRTASQLSQRWNIIKKRHGNSNVKTGSQLSEVQLAARRALNMALDQPGMDGLKASSIGRTKPSIPINTSIRPTPIVADTPSTSTLPQHKASEDSAITQTFPKTQPKTSVSSQKPLVNGPDAVKAAAVAAGARIATQSAAAAILKQQLKTAIHIKTNISGNARSSSGANFRDLHSPNVGIQLNPISTAPETSVVTISTSVKSPKKIQENPKVILGTAQDNQVNLSSRAHAEAGNLVKDDSSVLKTDSNTNVQETSEKDAKQDAGLTVVESAIGGDGEAVVMETGEDENMKQDQ